MVWSQTRFCLLHYTFYTSFPTLGDACFRIARHFVVGQSGLRIKALQKEVIDLPTNVCDGNGGMVLLLIATGTMIAIQ